MNVGIDWVSAGIFLVAYVISQIRAINIRVRFVILAVACAAIALYRLRIGAHGINFGIVVLAGILAVYYLVRAIQVRTR